MLKKLLKCLCFSCVFIIIACAPKPKVTPLPSYEETELTLEEVITKVSGDIEALKAITDIKIEKNDEPHSFIKASVLVKKPEWVHMRMYQLGILVRDFVIRDDRLYVLSGKNDQKLKTLGKELYNAIFWWEGYRNGIMQGKDDLYILRAAGKEIHVDRKTLLPVTQQIQTLDRTIVVTYDDPVNNDGFWYPALLNINVDEFRFTVKLKKMLKNPELGAFDFQIPADG